MSAYTPPADFPVAHHAAGPVPHDFAQVVVAAAAKNGTLFWDQLMAWAQQGAEHSRLCDTKTRTIGRTKK